MLSRTEWIPPQRPLAPKLACEKWLATITIGAAVVLAVIGIYAAA